MMNVVVGRIYGHKGYVKGALRLRVLEDRGNEFLVKVIHSEQPYISVGNEGTVYKGELTEDCIMGKADNS